MFHLLLAQLVEMLVSTNVKLYSKSYVTLLYVLMYISHTSIIYFSFCHPVLSTPTGKLEKVQSNSLLAFITRYILYYVYIYYL